MNANELLWLMLGITLINFLWNQLLDYLNYKNLSVQPPKPLTTIYEPAQYKTAMAYQKTRAQFSFINATYGFIISFVALASGFLGTLDYWLSPWFCSKIGLALAYGGVIFFTMDLLNIPFAWYSIFVIEEKFGFNKTTPKIFITDKLKGYLLGGLIGGVLGAILLYLILRIGPHFWLFFWAVAVLFMLLINLFYTSLIVPLFNKLTPLEEGDLKQAIQQYCTKVNFSMKNIYIIDGSKRSTKANAFFAGFGKKRKIVLYDTLLNNHTQAELIAILAHEVGHYKKNIFFGI